MCTTNEFVPFPTITIQSSKVKVITWTVNFCRFQLIPNCAHSVESEEFAFSGKMWKMCLGIENPKDCTKMKCYLKVTDCSYPAYVGHIILALDSSRDIVCSWGKRPKKDAESGKSVSSADDIVKTFEWPSRVISDGFLTLCCQLIPDEVYFEKQLKMLEEEQSTDVISFGKKHLKAHAFMLAAHSQAFNDMLNTEKQENQLNLTDFDYEVVKEMLTFIYTKRLPNLEKLADGLLRIDDKYNIKGLRERCEESFCESISTNNAIRLQALAEYHNFSQLKDKARDFIQRNLKAVQESADWKILMQKCYSDLIMRNCVQNYDCTEKEGQPANKKPRIPKD